MGSAWDQVADVLRTTADAIDTVKGEFKHHPQPRRKPLAIMGACCAFVGIPLVGLGIGLSTSVMVGGALVLIAILFLCRSCTRLEQADETLWLHTTQADAMNALIGLAGISRSEVLLAMIAQTWRANGVAPEPEMLGRLIGDWEQVDRASNEAIAGLRQKAGEEQESRQLGDVPEHFNNLGSAAIDAFAEHAPGVVHRTDTKEPGNSK